MADSNNRIGFLNLKNNGDTATIRVLHSSCGTIERSVTHWVTLSSGGRRSVKCVGAGCPLCNANFPSNERAYIHVIDLADMQEKVWTRTESFVNQLLQVEKQYGNLANLAITVVRGEYRNYPSYTITNVTQLNPSVGGNNLIDTKVAYRCYMSRTAEELMQYLATGQMPAHQKPAFVPKAQYAPNTATPYAGGAQILPTPQNVYMTLQPSPMANADTPPWIVNNTQMSPQNAQTVTYPQFSATQQSVPTPNAPSQDDPFSSPIFRV